MPTLDGRRVLDYGCEAGSFAQRMSSLGCQVTGIDSSPAMIEKAKAAYSDAVAFHVGDATLARDLGPFVLITSIMALQFISDADIEGAMADLVAALEPAGHLIFAVHNPASVSGETLRFSNGVTVPIFIRDAAAYNALAARLGLEPLLEEYPPFTEDFVARYPTYAGLAPEYLVLGYGKR